jgi:hypothetical protein
LCCDFSNVKPFLFLHAEESDSATFIVAQTLTNPKTAIEQRLKAERKKQAAAATNNGVSVPVQLISSNAFSSSSNTNSTSTTQLEVAATAADHAVESLASRLNIKNASRAGDDLVAKHSNVRRVKATEGDSNDNAAKKKGGKRKVPAVVDEVVVETTGIECSQMVLFCFFNLFSVLFFRSQR